METTATGMEGLTSALQGILTTDAFMANLTTLVPVIGGVLVLWRLRRLREGLAIL